MSRPAKYEYFRLMYERYRQASRQERSTLLDELCQTCGYNRKYAIRKLHSPRPPVKPKARRRPARSQTYGSGMLSILRQVWEAADCPWSVRLKALLPAGLPWIRRHFALTPDLEWQLLHISARQIDRRLQPHKRQLRRQLYGRTKPGVLLKHQIPIRAAQWRVQQPGWVEIDLVSHSGNSGDGQFIYSLNVTDIFTGWVETVAVFGKGQQGVVAALDEVARRLPFVLCGIDSDNGSEFINDYLVQYCRVHHLQFTRGRPYQKQDNAHIEQKNWTHVRKLLGWQRYDSRAGLAAINRLYAGDLRLMMNWFQPCVKLERKERVGSRIRRRYSTPTTPLDRLPKSKAVRLLQDLRETMDPFELSARITEQLNSIYQLANLRHSPKPVRRKPNLGYLFR